MTPSEVSLYLTVLLTTIYTVDTMAVIRQHHILNSRANRLKRTELNLNSTVAAAMGINNQSTIEVNANKKLKVSASTPPQTISLPSNATNNQQNNPMPRYNYTVYYPILSPNDTNNNNLSAPINETLEIHDHVIDQRPRQVTSINGTIDASQYNNADLDRLYNDALLVYFKNFNE